MSRGRWQHKPTRPSADEGETFAEHPVDSSYLVSDRGRVWSMKHGRLMNQFPAGDDGRYRGVHVSGRDGKRMRYVHHLVLETFVGPRPPGLEACHNDGNASNNELGNLRWDDRRGNMADAIRHGTTARGERNGSAKLTDDAVRQIRARRGLGTAQWRVAQEFGVTQMIVSLIWRDRIWRHVP